MATAELVSSGNADVVERLSSSEALNIWIDVLGELQEAMSQAPGDDGNESVLLILLRSFTYWNTRVAPLWYLSGKHRINLFYLTSTRKYPIR